MEANVRNPISAQMRLYDERNRRLYINAEERERFLKVADRQSLKLRAFCLTLFYTGCRPSEGLALTVASVDAHSRIVSIRTLKKRRLHQIREVPIPPVLADVLADLVRQRLAESRKTDPTTIYLFDHHGQPLSRVGGYRWVKGVMKEAGIRGAQASPKGLRHGYGVHALRSGVPLNMLRKWMGHSSIETTAIYANAVGKEEMEIAGRMWDVPA